jgi:fused signal recognition particle receptor
MFGLLKKKLNNFGDKLKHNLNKKAEEIPKEKDELLETADEKEIEEKLAVEQETVLEEKVEKELEKETEKIIETTPKKEIIETVEETEELQAEEEPSEREKQEIEKLRKEMEEELEEFKEEIEPAEEIKVTEEKKEALEELIEDEPEEIEDEVKEKTRDIEIKKVDEDKRELKTKVGAGGKLKGLFSGKIEIKEKDVENLLEELELSLIESDVEQDAAKEITEKIKEKLVGEKVSIKHINQVLQEHIKEILTEMMETKQFDLLSEVKASEKPYKILMLGPNGAGKTTSIAKLTKMFQDNGLTCVWAAGDTFRSGAIDQLKIHAEKLGVKVISQQYGADPAAVAFDAVKSAKASNADVVLIDTAGRQETNKNLMEELKKIERVVDANLKIYVGEAFTGQGLLDMAKDFDNTVGIDGFILTKIDTDAKGGTTISLLYRLKKPILYVGTGQEYDDFEKFTPEFVLNRII